MDMNITSTFHFFLIMLKYNKVVLITKINTLLLLDHAIDLAHLLVTLAAKRFSPYSMDLIALQSRNYQLLDIFKYDSKVLGQSPPGQSPQGQSPLDNHPHVGGKPPIQ